MIRSILSVCFFLAAVSPVYGAAGGKAQVLARYGNWVDNGSSYHELAVNDRSLFWVDGRDIKQIDKRGGNVQVVVTGLDPFNAGLFATNTHLYWADYDKDSLVTIIRLTDLATGATRNVLRVGGGWSAKLTGDKEYVYVNVYTIGKGNGIVKRIDLTDNNIQHLYSETEHFDRMVIENALFAGGTHIWEMSKLGGSMRRLATAGSDILHDLFSSGVYVYWAEGRYNEKYRVLRVHKDGGPAQVLFETKQHFNPGLAVAKGMLLFVKSGKLMGIAVENPSTPQVVMEGIYGIRRFHVDGDTLFGIGGQEVVRVDLP